MYYYICPECKMARHLNAIYATKQRICGHCGSKINPEEVKRQYDCKMAKEAEEKAKRNDKWALELAKEKRQTMIILKYIMLPSFACMILFPVLGVLGGPSVCLCFFGVSFFCLLILIAAFNGLPENFADHI